MTKPRLMLVRGVWHCVDDYYFGAGKTPIAAYNLWRRAWMGLK